jgi:hypothetical protein
MEAQMTPEHGDAVVTAVEAKVRSLATMSLRDLREVWRQEWGEPPKFRSAQLLRQLLAWRLQAVVFGGLDPETRAKIRSGRKPRQLPPTAGSRLTREYQGVLHTVEMRDDGVYYEGRRFRSLSAAASAIAGSHWNGPRFFGLRGGRE